MALPHAKPGQVVDLSPLGAGLHDAISIALIKEKHFEAARLIIHAGEDMPPHKVAGDIMLHCLEGRIVLGLAASEVILKSGDWLFLKGGELHSLKGIEDSSLLLTILFGK
jgi:quercetin dioxygenase-like cupin family protein